MFRRLQIFLFLLVGCSGPSVTAPDLPVLPTEDAGVEEEAVELTVSLSAVTVETPYPIATIRGSAPGARRVLISGGPNPVSVAVNPDGSFCYDFQLELPAGYEFQVTAQGSNGELSTSSASTTFLYATNYPPLPDALTCSGAHPSSCIGATESCGNLRDDDCDGAVDSLDSDCPDYCDDDAFEPNDTGDSPRIELGRHDGLTLCGANDDYFRVYAHAGETLTAQIYFVHDEGDLDMYLMAIGYNLANGQIEYSRVDNDQGDSADDDELITYEVGATGEYLIRVFNVNESSNSEYTLNVRAE